MKNILKKILNLPFFILEKYFDIIYKISFKLNKITYNIIHDFVKKYNINFEVLLSKISLIISIILDLTAFFYVLLINVIFIVDNSKNLLLSVFLFILSIHILIMIFYFFRERINFLKTL